MFGIFKTIRRLRAMGVLGMNQRNAEFILAHNPRRLFPLVDDKLRMRDLCAPIGVPTPAIYQTFERYRCLRDLGRRMAGLRDFVLKPARGAAGRGIAVIGGRAGGDFLKQDGQRIGLDQLHQHCSDILSGMYSLGGQPDVVLVQERVRLHPTFEAVVFQGIPDVRVIVYRDQAAMAMLRLPTRASGGRANLHQGGIGAGVDLASGLTCHAVQFDRTVDIHPDTGVRLVGFSVPCWPQVLEIACRVARAVGLGYVGVDIVVDARQGPMLLEANARPGLAIQIANNRGLVPVLKAIDGLRDSVASADVLSFSASQRSPVETDLTGWSVRSDAKPRDGIRV